MWRCILFRGRRSCLPVLVFLTAHLRVEGQEFRALWADAWGEGFQNATEVSQLIADTRAGNLNAVVTQVRRRGDAFYNSHFEPKNAGLDAGFDPLADLLSKAHNTNNGQRIAVHAWIVTYHIWTGSTLPTQPDHPLRLHPDWLLKDVNGNTFIGNQYTFDPGHPDVQRHTFNVCLDILTNYNVDGLNFDYIRFSSANEGYNDVSVARFNRQMGRTGQPAPQDAVWKQWRRDQITSLLRKVYLHALAVRPEVVISADTITWAPSVTSDAEWYSKARAYNDVLQDWRGWMEEGILDLNIPMTYFRHHDPTYARDYTNWSNFAKNHRYNRHTAIGPGIYLNIVSNSILQMRQTREVASGGSAADGVCGYSYRVTNTTNSAVPTVVSRATFLNALVAPSVYDSITPPIFATPAPLPTMPWKTTPTRGHLKGFAVNASTGAGFDGAAVAITGPVNKAMITDATGFFGAVDLPPGDYVLTVSTNGFVTGVTNFTITAGVVTTRDFSLTQGAPSIVAQPQSQSVGIGETAVFTVTAMGGSPLGCFWRKNGAIVPNSGSFTLTLTNVQPANAGNYYAVVTNAYGTALSSNVSLSVTLPFLDLQAAPGVGSAIISWRTPVPATTQVEFSGGTIPPTLSPLEPQPLTQHAVLLSGLAPDTRYSVQAIGRYGTNEYRSAEISFNTAGTLILDNVDAVFTGGWSTATTASDKYLSDYCFGSTVSGTATRTARYTPNITTPGNYDVYVWYPQGGNRSANAPHTVVFDGGSVTIGVNQTANGGGWRLLTAGKPFASGTNGYVQIANNSGESGKSVMADGVKFVFSPGQEPPVGPTAPVWWSQYYFPSNVNALADHDGDGYATWEEFCLGTNPTNAASAMEFRIEESTGLQAVFSPFLTGRVYGLECLTNLPGSWQAVTNFTLQIRSNNQAAILIHSNGSPQSLYRLKVDWVR